jgi:hypothetical protein
VQLAEDEMALGEQAALRTQSDPQSDPQTGADLGGGPGAGALTGESAADGMEADDTLPDDTPPTNRSKAGNGAKTSTSRRR